MSMPMKSLEAKSVEGSFGSCPNGLAGKNEVYDGKTFCSGNRIGVGGVGVSYCCSSCMYRPIQTEKSSENA